MCKVVIRFSSSLGFLDALIMLGFRGDVYEGVVERDLAISNWSFGGSRTKPWQVLKDGFLCY